MFKLIPLIIFFLSFCCKPVIYFYEYRENAPENRKKPYVILVSIDGYRYDYTKKFNPPMIMEIIKDGTEAEGLIPVFPSETFSSHYSLITGMYPESTGILSNRFYDPKFKEYFYYSDTAVSLNPKWYKGLPLWTAIELAEMRTACMFWPSSDTPVNEIHPGFYYRYEEDFPYTKRIEQVLTWLKLPEIYRPHFITLYFDSVDIPSHHFGHVSYQVFDSIMEMDILMENLLIGIEDIGLDVNIIITSDHGMEPVSKKGIIYLDEIINLDKFEISGGKIAVNLFSDDDNLIEKSFKKLKKYQKFFRVYKNSQIPASLHYRNDRAGDIFLEALPPYVIEKRSRKQVKKIKYVKGLHGYDPYKTKNMWGIFYAKGPNIRKRKKIKAFKSIHLYPFILKILGVDIPDNLDGSFEVFKGIYIK
jgi:alkaline phosphatase D